MIHDFASRWTIPFCALVLCSVILYPCRAAARTELRVPQDHATIQAAIDAANGSAGDIVLVSCGTYHETLEIPSGKSGITIQSESGDPDCVTVDAQRTGRVIQCRSNVTIRGLTITGGDGDLFGGGLLHHEEADGTSIVRCVIADNTARSGGGVYSLGGGITLEDCQLLRNEAEGGGGLYAVGSAFVSGCTFSSNVAIDRGGAIGGGSTFNGVVTASTFYRNRATEGSAFSLRNESIVSIDQCLIAFGEGDAIRCYENTQLSIWCSDIFGQMGGDWVDLGSVGCLADRLGSDGNVSADPQLCAVDPDQSGSWALQNDSPCTPSGSDCGLIGAWDVGCGPVATHRKSWGGLKTRFR